MSIMARPACSITSGGRLSGRARRGTSPSTSAPPRSPWSTSTRYAPSSSGAKKFDVPGLLFIDTPGHHAFTTLRARGGSLADIAVLVVDINEGIKPQTLESMNILRKYKTPFIIALNKIDLVQGWQSVKGKPFILNMKEQSEDATNMFEEKMYKVIARFAQEGYSADRYDRIEDFTRNIALVPVSARTGEGVPDLLLVLIGLAQRFLEQNLHTEEGPARGTVLEVKEEKGLGPTIDVIVYSGALRKGDILGLGTNGRPLVTKVKAILKPRPLDEIRDPRDKFDSVDEVTAAAGVKLLCQDLEGVVAGGPLRVIKGNKQAILDEIAEETKVRIEVVDAGVFIKADALGSLEALAFECAHSQIPIRKYEVGPISKRDVIEVSAYNDLLHRAILAFNVPMLPDAKDALPNHDAKIFLNDVVYGLIDDYKLWVAEVQEEGGGGQAFSGGLPGQGADAPQLRVPRQQASDLRSSGPGWPNPHRAEDDRFQRQRGRQDPFHPLWRRGQEGSDPGGRGGDIHRRTDRWQADQRRGHPVCGHTRVRGEGHLQPRPEPGREAHLGRADRDQAQEGPFLVHVMLPDRSSPISEIANQRTKRSPRREYGRVLGRAPVNRNPARIAKSIGHQASLSRPSGTPYVAPDQSSRTGCRTSRWRSPAGSPRRSLWT